VNHLDHGDMVANILATWDHASPVQREAGARWYPEAGKLAAMIADQTGIDTRRVVLTIAALSPRNPWRWNVFDAYSFAVARAEGRACPKATTFKRNWAAAWRALDPTVTEPRLTSALKVRAFVDAIMGDLDSVVVDTWAVRVATGGALRRVNGDRQYRLVAHAYNVAANLRDVPPSTMQATTWLVAQTEGLATLRTGRHDLAFKAGTPAWLQAALTASAE
jgi:hypothetical protein